MIKETGKSNFRLACLHLKRKGRNNSGQENIGTYNNSNGRSY